MLGKNKIDSTCGMTSKFVLWPLHACTYKCMHIYKCVHAHKYVYMWDFGQRMWEQVVMLKVLFWMDTQEPQSTQSQTLNYPHWAFCVSQGRSSGIPSPCSSAHACPCSPHSDVSRAMLPASCGDRGWVQQLLCPWIAHGLVEMWLKKKSTNSRILDSSKCYNREKDNFPKSLNLLPILIDLIR